MRSGAGGAPVLLDGDDEVPEAGHSSTSTATTIAAPAIAITTIGQRSRLVPGAGGAPETFV
jgi:hypothetical protein